MLPIMFFNYGLMILTDFRIHYNSDKLLQLDFLTQEGSLPGEWGEEVVQSPAYDNVVIDGYEARDDNCTVTYT